MNRSYIIGIDGGASKTDFVLCNLDGIVINRFFAASCNPNDIGMECCIDVLIQGIAKLTFGLEKAEIHLYAGISGGATGNNPEIINQYLSRYFKNYKIYNGSDAVNAMQLGLHEEDGIALIAGTGSIVYSRRKQLYKRIGGWGYLFDNGGSGYHLGRDAINAALCEFDGTGGKTILTSLIEEKLGMPVAEALAEIYTKGKRYIASFAPLVFDGFRQQDPIAQEIIRRNATFLTRQIHTGAMDFPENNILVSCIGGLFRQRDILLPIMQEELGKKYQLYIPELEPVFGAVREACRLAGIRIIPEFESNFKDSVDRLMEASNDKDGNA